MSIDEFQDQLTEEIGAILAGDFSASITETTSVPTQDDPAITFPNTEEDGSNSPV